MQPMKVGPRGGDKKLIKCFIDAATLYQEAGALVESDPEKANCLEKHGSCDDEFAKANLKKRWLDKSVLAARKEDFVRTCDLLNEATAIYQRAEEKWEESPKLARHLKNAADVLHSAALEMMKDLPSGYNYDDDFYKN